MMLNSTLVIDHLYLHALAISAPTRVFMTQGEGYVRGLVSISALPTGAGALFVSGGGDVVLDDIRTLTGTVQFGGDRPPFLALTDIDSTAAADSVYVRAWGEARQPKFLADADYQVLHDDGPNLILGVPLSRDRNLVLPSHTNLWSGRHWEIRKVTGAGGALNILDRDRRPIATISGSEKAAVRVTFNRTLANGPRRGWTSEKSMLS